jgi:hypothetical protein
VLSSELAQAAQPPLRDLGIAVKDNDVTVLCLLEALIDRADKAKVFCMLDEYHSVFCGYFAAVICQCRLWARVVDQVKIAHGWIVRAQD